MSHHSVAYRSPSLSTPLRPAWTRDGTSALPRPLTTLIGRQHEIASVSAMVRDESLRLVTLTGPGGVGKTRLALAVAAELKPEFADGVFIVGLAPIHDPALVLPALADMQAIGELGISRGGDDDLHRGGGNDTLHMGVGTDDLFVIDNGAGDTDPVLGGKGNDFVDVFEDDETRDVVDCGPGLDEILFDSGSNAISNCEIQHPL